MTRSRQPRLFIKSLQVLGLENFGMRSSFKVITILLKTERPGRTRDSFVEEGALQTIERGNSEPSSTSSTSNQARSANK